MNIIKQTKINNCGAACLTTVVNFFNKTNFTIIEMEKSFNIKDDEDMNLEVLSLELSRFKINNIPAKEIDLEKDLKNGKYIICIILNSEKQQHYVIVKKKENILIVFDSSKDKKYKISISEFNNYFLNIGIFIEKEKFEKQQFNIRIYLDYKTIFSFLILQIFLMLVLILKQLLLRNIIKEIVEEQYFLWSLLFILLISILEIILIKLVKNFINKIYEFNYANSIKKESEQNITILINANLIEEYKKLSCLNIDFKILFFIEICQNFLVCIFSIFIFKELSIILICLTCFNIYFKFFANEYIRGKEFYIRKFIGIINIMILLFMIFKSFDFNIICIFLYFLNYFSISNITNLNVTYSNYFKTKNKMYNYVLNDYIKYNNKKR
ncbi:cysteine peptidase family C39 domain-containing protein [Mesoplasma photuris]|uniref:cysteine peptidase family C39 domain-containing protein n=1 Tax=Mesoplasma photuris TaxID=217731 RepID=UPI0004E14055|nr:cysteine peptidase family C39 domain-containing protein [Mesoplasma photuris]